jgi:hypothetical protein
VSRMKDWLGPVLPEIDPSTLEADDVGLREFLGIPSVGATVIAAAINIARVTLPQLVRKPLLLMYLRTPTRDIAVAITPPPVPPERASPSAPSRSARAICPRVSTPVDVGPLATVALLSVLHSMRGDRSTTRSHRRNHFARFLIVPRSSITRRCAP